MNNIEYMNIYLLFIYLLLSKKEKLYTNMKLLLISKELWEISTYAWNAISKR